MGELVWSYLTGYMVISRPAVANGVVYVGSWDGKDIRFRRVYFGKEFRIMHGTQTYNGGENFDLQHFLLQGRNLALAEKLAHFDAFIENAKANGESLCMREIGSASDRTVLVRDPATDDARC